MGTSTRIDFSSFFLLRLLLTVPLSFAKGRPLRSFLRLKTRPACIRLGIFTNFYFYFFILTLYKNYFLTFNCFQIKLKCKGLPTDTNITRTRQNYNTFTFCTYTYLYTFSTIHSLTPFNKFYYPQTINITQDRQRLMMNNLAFCKIVFILMRCKK